MIIFLKWLKVVCHVWKHLPQQNTPCLILLHSLLIVSEDKDCFCTARIRQWTSYSYITFIGTLFLWFRMHIQNWCQFNSILYTVCFFYNWHKKIICGVILLPTRLVFLKWHSRPPNTWKIQVNPILKKQVTSRRK